MLQPHLEFLRQTDLDFGCLIVDQSVMKLLVFIVAMVIPIAPALATTLTRDGDLTWNITEPRCSFQLKGNLKNGTTLSSGPLKLVLRASPSPFPSVGYNVAEYSLGSIGGGYQLSNFTVKTPSKLPSISGSFHFTIVIAEYTGGSWKSVLAVPTGQRTLEIGNFVGQKKWLLPTATVLLPKSVITPGDIFKLSLKATDEKNLFPANLQEKMTIMVNTKTSLTTTVRSVAKSAKYSYAIRSGKLGKKKVDYGQLTIDYGSNGKGVSKAVYSFYFHSLTSGTYRCVETNTSGKESTWGSFNLY